MIKTAGAIRTVPKPMTPQEISQRLKRVGGAVPLSFPQVGAGEKLAEPKEEKGSQQIGNQGKSQGRDQGRSQRRDQGRDQEKDKSRYEALGSSDYLGEDTTRMSGRGPSIAYRPTQVPAGQKETGLNRIEINEEGTEEMTGTEESGEMNQTTKDLLVLAGGIGATAGLMFLLS